MLIKVQLGAKARVFCSQLWASPSSRAVNGMTARLLARRLGLRFGWGRRFSLAMPLGRTQYGTNASSHIAQGAEGQPMPCPATQHCPPAYECAMWWGQSIRTRHTQNWRNPPNSLGLQQPLWVQHRNTGVAELVSLYPTTLLWV